MVVTNWIIFYGRNQAHNDNSSANNNLKSKIKFFLYYNFNKIENCQPYYRNCYKILFSLLTFYKQFYCLLIAIIKDKLVYDRYKYFIYKLADSITIYVYKNRYDITKFLSRILYHFYLFL